MRKWSRVSDYERDKTNGVLDLCTFPHQLNKSTCSATPSAMSPRSDTVWIRGPLMFCNVCLKYPPCNLQCVNVIFCEFSPRQCFSLGLSQLGSHPSKTDYFGQTLFFAIDGILSLVDSLVAIEPSIRIGSRLLVVEYGQIGVRLSAGLSENWTSDCCLLPRVLATLRAPDKLVSQVFCF